MSADPVGRDRVFVRRGDGTVTQVVRTDSPTDVTLWLLRLIDAEDCAAAWTYDEATRALRPLVRCAWHAPA